MPRRPTHPGELTDDRWALIERLPLPAGDASSPTPHRRPTSTTSWRTGHPLRPAGTVPRKDEERCPERHAGPPGQSRPTDLRCRSTPPRHVPSGLRRSALGRPRTLDAGGSRRSAVRTRTPSTTSRPQPWMSWTGESTPRPLHRRRPRGGVPARPTLGPGLQHSRQLHTARAHAHHPYLGRHLLARLRVVDVLAWLRGRKTRPSSRTLRSVLILLERAIRYAQIQEMVSRNVAEFARVDQRGRCKGDRLGRPSTSMTLDQVVAAFKTAEGTRWYAYLVTSIVTGARAEEIRALRWEQVATAGEIPTIHVWISVREGVDTKAHRSRWSSALPAPAGQSPRRPPGDAGP